MIYKNGKYFLNIPIVIVVEIVSIAFLFSPCI